MSNALAIGCNALYPYGRIAAEADFGLDAHRESLRRLSAAGLSHIEYSHPQPLSLVQAQELRAFADDLGLIGWSCHDWGDRLALTIPRAAALGCGVVVVHAPLGHGLDLRIDTPIPELISHDLALLEPAAAMAADYGISLALENGGYRDHLVYVLGLIARMDRANVGVCVDSGHAALGDLGPAEAIRMAGDLLCTLHLHDNDGLRDDHLPPGEGRIDWDAVFAALRSVGYDGPLIAELTDCPRGGIEDQERTLSAAHRFLAERGASLYDGARQQA